MVSLDDVKIHSSSLPLFADIGQFNTLPDTKTFMSSTQANDYLISLGDLIDWDKTESTTFEQYQIKAIPFKEEFCSGTVSVTAEDMDNPTADSLSCSRIFYVNTLDTETDTTDLMVVTMIPDQTYLSEHSISEISYLDKGEYSGLILYADIDGTFREAGYFYKGRIVPTYPLQLGDTIQDNENIHYLTTYQSGETKGLLGNLLKKLFRIAMADAGGGNTIYGGTLASATCEGTAGKSEPNTGGETGYNNPTQGNNDDTSVGNGKGKRGAGNVNNNNKRNYVKSERQSFTVSLTAQKDSTNIFRGSVSGNGVYSRGSLVTIIATANNGYIFDRWTGNIPGESSYISIHITKDIKGTAMFWKKGDVLDQRPCWNGDKKIYNPLANMEIAPTDSGNLDNGVFSKNNPQRYSGHHDGIDLAAEVGTPIYAPYDGTISYPFVTEQPQRDITGKWAKGYTGDKDGAGNRINIKCTLASGETITYAFWHLQADTPVAVNPRTGATFKPGDEVYQGDIIGYVGRTGNAYKIKNTHLHLGVRNSTSTWINPEPYLNGTVEKDDAGKVSQAQLTDVRCDDQASYYDGNNTTSSGMNK